MAQEPERSATPEKQLLNLIEDPKAAGAGQEKIRRNPFNLFSLDALKGRVSFLGEKFRQSLTPGKIAFDLKGVNRLLWWAMILLVLVLTWHLTVSLKGLNAIPDLSREITRKSSDPQAISDKAQKIDPYLEKVRTRNIFRFGGIAVPLVQEKDEPAPEVLPPSEADELAKSLRLVGIGWSNDPDVMIENTATKKVYFLKRGDVIDDRIKINAIFQDRVILFYEGREIELR